LNRACAMFQRALEVNAADKDARYWLDRLAVLLAQEQQQRSDGDAASENDGGSQEVGGET